MQVLEMLTRAHQRLAIVSANAPLAQVAGLLGLEYIHLAVVCDSSGSMVGVITDRDIVRSVSDCRAGPDRLCNMNAATAMTREVVSCRLADKLNDVWSAMKRNGLGHVPVINEDRIPLGVLYASDVLDYLFEESLLRRTGASEFPWPLDVPAI